MDPAVAFPTKSDEVFFNIIAQLTSWCNVVNLTAHVNRTIGTASRSALGLSSVRDFTWPLSRLAPGASVKL